MSLKDIAAEVGVSVSTVSRVLNTEHTTAASKELQRKIWEAAKAQGYAPNLTARRLKKGNSSDGQPCRFLYCVYACPPWETKDDPFYSKLLESIEYEAFRHNYVIKYTFSANVLSRMQQDDLLPSGEDDCLIILGRFEAPLLKRLKNRFKKIISISLNILDIPCDQIVCNGYDAAQDAVSYFHSLNHKNIGFIGSPEGRFYGYQKAMENLKLPISLEAVVSNVTLSMDGGHKGMLRLLEQAPDLTAVFCANDMVAIGALRACQERGIRVPEDLSLLGMNDIENIQYTTPMLSSIRVPLDEMGKMAVTILLDRTNGGHSSPLRVLFPHTLIKRDSCRKLE